MKYLCPIEHARRITTAQNLIIDGGNLSDFANAIGISKAGACFWLSRKAPDLRRQLADNGLSARGGEYNKLSVEEHLRRMKIISNHKTCAAAAREIGISRSGLHGYINRQAPFGIEEAIEHFSEVLA